MLQKVTVYVNAATECSPYACPSVNTSRRRVYEITLIRYHESIAFIGRLMYLIV